MFPPQPPSHLPDPLIAVIGKYRLLCHPSKYLLLEIHPLLTHAHPESQVVVLYPAHIGVSWEAFLQKGLVSGF